jgi:hypothetical protein
VITVCVFRSIFIFINAFEISAPFLRGKPRLEKCYVKSVSKKFFRSSFTREETRQFHLVEGTRNVLWVVVLRKAVTRAKKPGAGASCTCELLWYLRFLHIFWTNKFLLLVLPHSNELKYESMAENVSMLVFWVVTTCKVDIKYPSWRWRQCVSKNNSYIPARRSNPRSQHQNCTFLFLNFALLTRN